MWERDKERLPTRHVSINQSTFRLFFYVPFSSSFLHVNFIFLSIFFRNGILSLTCFCVFKPFFPIWLLCIFLMGPTYTDDAQTKPKNEIYSSNDLYAEYLNRNLWLDLDLIKKYQKRKSEKHNTWSECQSISTSTHEIIFQFPQSGIDGC